MLVAAGLVFLSAAARAQAPDPGSDEAGLVLPVMDYEFAGVEEIEASYAPLRPPFSHSFSPRLPAGQNLGRQLAWQKERYPEAFYLPMSQFDPSAIPDPRGRQVVFACRSGSRSVTALKAIRKPVKSVYS